jgi:hypothetical protein
LGVKGGLACEADLVAGGLLACGYFLDFASTTVDTRPVSTS